MTDWQKDWEAGKNDLMHPPGGNRRAFDEGKAALQHDRQMTDMFRRHHDTMNQLTARPLPPSAPIELPDDPAARAAIAALVLAAAGYFLVPKSFVAWLVVTLAYAILGAVIVFGVVGTTLWGVMRLAGARVGWLQAAWSATATMLIGGVTATAIALLAIASADTGGPELIPGMREAVAAGSLDPMTPLDRTGLSALLVLLAVALGAGAWLLNLSLPRTPRVPRAVRWTGLALILLLAPVAGVLLAIGLGATTMPADLMPVLNLTTLTAMGTAIAIATGLAAAAAGGLVAWLRRRGWKVSAAGDAARHVALGFLAYCVFLMLLMVLYRAGDDLVLGLGRLVTPGNIGSAGFAAADLLGFLLLQAAPFGLFAAIVSETQHERRALDRLRLALLAQAALLAIAVAAILLFWMVRFLSTM